MKKIICILLILGINLSYSQLKDSLGFSKRKLLLEQVDDEIDSLSLKKMSEEFKKSIGKPYTTTFYEIFLDVKVKKTYNLHERKTFSIGISNWGCKDLFVPSYLIYGYKGNLSTELYVEFYKENLNGVYEPYKVNSKDSHYQYRSENRNILALKNQYGHTYNDLTLDLLKTLNEEGKYYAKIYIDLSNFGYFKIVTSTTLPFEVIY